MADEWEEFSVLVQDVWKQMRTIKLPRLPPVKSRKLDCSDSTSPKFQYFSSLPIELRDTIWRSALPEPTLVDLNNKLYSTHEPTQYWHSTVPAPVLLGVCRESRAVVLKHYERAFKDENGRGGTWVDFKVDVFWLRNFEGPDGSINVDDFKGDFQKIRILVLAIDGMKCLREAIVMDEDDDDEEDYVEDDDDDNYDHNDEDRIVGWWPKQFEMAMSKLEHIILVNLDDNMLYNLLNPRGECNPSDDISKEHHMSPTHDDYTIPYDPHDPHDENNMSDSGDMHSEFFNIKGTPSTRYECISEIDSRVWVPIKYNSRIPFLFSYLIKSSTEWKQNPTISVPNFERSEWPEFFKQDRKITSLELVPVIAVVDSEMFLHHYLPLGDSHTQSEDW